MGPYGLHKLISEQECKLYSKLYELDTVSLRYFNVFSEDQDYGGSYSTVICAWMEMIKEGLPLRIDGDGEQARDFIHVDDVVAANLFCLHYKKNFKGRAYDVGTGEEISINDIKNIVDINNKVEFVYAPERKGDVKTTKADIQKLKKIGWSAKLENSNL
jgi:nucleoside-diphosphate-sugar epimerase